MEPTNPGAQLGKYLLVAEIARGGMGVVYLAQARGLADFKKLVVVKELKAELAEDDKFRTMFLDEARLAARLSHRNIVQTLEVDQDGGRYFFVMEYLDGRTFHAASRLKGDRALPVPTILWILCDVLAALHHAHELTDFDGAPLNVVHRDVSPRNIFLTYDGQVKLLDFGVAKAAGRDLETGVGELKGRIPFMAPEHVTDRNVDRRADVFSAGVVLREALTSARVWDGHNEIEILHRLIKHDVPPLPEDVDVPDELRAIIVKAMAPDRDARYLTAHEMRGALEKYVRRVDATGAFAGFGERLAKEFADHRAQMKALIEQHVTRARSIPPTRMAVPALPSSSSDLAAAARANEPARADDSRPGPSASQPPTPLTSSATPPGARAPSAAVRPPAKREISLPPPAKKAGVGTYLLAGLGFVLVVAGLTAAMLSTRQQPGASTPSTDEAPTHAAVPARRPSLAAATASAAPEADRVEVTIRAMPATAQIAVDGVLVGEGPYTAKYERNSRHYLRVSAPGYVTRAEPVTMTATASMNVVLEKEAGATPPVRRPAPRASVAPSEGEAPSHLRQ